MSAEDLNKSNEHKNSPSEKITKDGVEKRFSYLNNKLFVKRLKDAGVKDEEIATLIHIDRDSFKEVKRANVWIEIEDKNSNGKPLPPNTVKIVMITKERTMVRGKNIDPDNPSHFSSHWIENKYFQDIFKITRIKTPIGEWSVKPRSADELEKELNKT